MQEERKKAEAAEKAKQEAKNKKKNDKVDEDPTGEQLLKKTMEDGPLTLATSFVQKLQQAWPGKVPWLLTL